MVRKLKHQFHCEKCGSGCTIYRKGKSHRVLVCPNCGVLATNPFSLGKAVLGAAKTLPIAGAVIGAVSEGFTSSPAPAPTPVHHERGYRVDRVTQALHVR